MNTEIKSMRPLPRMTLFRIPNQVSDHAVAPRRAVLETKRSILKKLSVRINKGDCFSS